MEQHYNVYGLTLASELPLPELPCVAVGARWEATIRLVPGQHRDPAITQWVKFDRREAILAVANTGLFECCHGNEIRIAPIPGARTSLLRLYLLGPVLAALLYQRGRLALHAGSVQLGDAGVAFVGESGWGKSTLLGLFNRQGHRLIADDLAAVDLATGTAQVFPGIPQIKLHADSATFLGFDFERLPVLDPVEKKRALRWAESEPLPREAPLSTGVPLKRLYVLDAGDRLEIEQLDLPEAVMQLVRHSYPIRARHPGDSLHLMQCSQLAKRIPIYRLRCAPGLAALPELAQRLEEEIMELSR